MGVKKLFVLHKQMIFQKPKSQVWQVVFDNVQKAEENGKKKTKNLTFQRAINSCVTLYVSVR